MLRNNLLKLARKNPTVARAVLPLLKTSSSLEDNFWAYATSGSSSVNIDLPIESSLVRDPYLVRHQPVTIGFVHGVQATDPSKILSFTLKKGKGADSYQDRYIVSKSGLSTDPSDPMPGDHIFKDFKAAKRFWDALGDAVTEEDGDLDPEFNRWMFCHILTSSYQQKKRGRPLFFC